MIRLFTSFYNEQHPERKAELVTCLNKNVQNELIDIIYVIIEPDATKPIIDEKIIYVQSQRPTFSDFFKLANLSADEEDISIISNSDIYFDESLVYVNKIKENECFALSRWEAYHLGNIRFKQVTGVSQDVWIFRGMIKNIVSDFKTGVLGCDNRLAHEIKESSYAISNPSKTIRCLHLHNSNIRNYSRTESIPQPYLPVPVTELA